MDTYPICNNQVIIQRVEDYYSVFSPLENRGIVVAEQNIKQLLKFCNGKNCVEDISRRLEIEPEKLIKTLELLWDKGIIFYKDKPKCRYISPKILDFWLHITNNCNLKCKYCYIRKNEASIDIEKANYILKKLIDSCVNQNVSELHVRFSGGEPLLCKDKIQQIIDYAESLSTNLVIKYGVLTNGTLIDYETFLWLKKNHIYISVSLDGIGNFNDVSRCYADGSGSYNNIIKGIDLLKAEGYPLGIMTTITRGNLKGLPALTEVLAEKHLLFRYSLEKTNEKGIFPELCKHIDELIDTLNRCLDIMESQIDEGNIYFQFQFCDIQFRRPRLRICSAGDRSLAVDHNNSLAICGMGLAEPCGNIGEADDLYKLVRDRNQDLLAASVDNFEPCFSCEWKYSCAGGCPLLRKVCYGEYKSKSPYCKVFKSIIPRLLFLESKKILSYHKKKEGKAWKFSQNRN